MSSGALAIGVSAPDASAALDVTSTAKGFLPPRLTTVQVGAVATPADGLIVYDVDTDTLKLRANGAWVSLAAGSTTPDANSLDFSEFKNGMTLDASTDFLATGTNVLSITNTGSSNSFIVNDQAGDASPFVIDAAGNVGVGTSSPNAALDVKGTIRLSGATSGYVGLAPASVAGSTTYTLPASDGTSGFQLTTNGAGVLSWAAAGPNTTALSGLTAATANNTIDSSAFTQTWNWSTATTQNSLTLTANALTTGSLLSLTSTGASINSTNGLLYVANTGAITNGTVARIASNSTAGSGLTVLANGNIGIGTTTPATAFDVVQAASLIARFRSTPADSTSAIALQNDARRWDIAVRGDDADKLYISDTTAGLNRIAIDSSGNVGIGTSSPGSILTVGANSGTNGKIQLNGSTSGSVSLQAAAAAGSATYTLPAADGANGQALTTNGSGALAWSTPSAVAKGQFYKADSSTVGFTRTGNGTVSVKAGTQVEVNGSLVIYSSDTAVTMPTLTAGTDYAIYACGSGAPVADSNLSSTTSCTGGSRKIGGFHYAPGGNASGQSGGDTTAQINIYSLWDLKWRPSCPNPAGMTLVANWFWADIYLLNTQPDTNGTSKFNVTIADGSSPPRVPAAFGGNGTTAYGTLTWYEASEVMAAYGKALLSQAEFAAAAYGTTENSSGGTDPGSTILRAAYTSKWGVMLASGNLWVWGRDMNMRWDGANGWNWRNNNGGRGQIYIGGDYNLVAALLGGHWANGAASGSRASYWSHSPWFSYYYLGARGRCDHLRLE